MFSIDGSLKRIMDIPGARSVTLADGASGLAIAAAGEHEGFDEHEDAAATTDVVRAVLSCPTLSTEADGDVTEIVVCNDRGYHLLNFLDADFDGRLFVHVVFDESSGGNLAMARYQIKSILTEFSEERRER
ncbi:hypothetical protein [Nocardia thailandica]|uniref:hypothetical protein n=1 Tax=Nocardia thailandica TaxID=257275 RepID=UPI000302011B|nr:hypothetical protein [Nocardia thailandica]